jgi:Na+/citrate or Na+/malate symporter
MSKEKARNDFWNNLMIGFIPVKWFTLYGIITLIGMFLGCSPKGFLGGFTVCTILGLLLEKIGNNLPFVKTYLGGGSFVALFVSAVLMYLGIFPETTTSLITDFIKNMDYIGMIVGALICGSILTMNRKLLIRAGALYFIPIAGGIIFAFSLTGIIGQLMGYGWREAILFISLPIMGGGTSAGAVPTAQTYANTLAHDNSYYLSLIMPAVVIGNAVSIVMGGVMNSVGERFPSMTGNGNLMKGKDLETSKENTPAPDIASIGRGWVITGIFFTIGIIIGKFIPAIHYYAWTIIACAICKISGLFPEKLQKDVEQWYQFCMKLTLPAVLFGIGFVYTDLGVIIQNFSLNYFIMVLTTVLGAILGAGLFGKLVGFFPVESAITAGLCMSNMGGTGDVATLGAAKRMELMPFAQISSRLGGAIIIVLASLLPAVFGGGL